MNILNKKNTENSNEFILTRYLYIYDEVKLALLFALLEKQKMANFWAYEIYFSGFKKEFIEWLWTIYYDFFATLNPSFENFFLTKEKEKDFSDVTIKTIVDNLLIRPFSTDVFMLSKLFEEKELYYKSKYLLHLDLTTKIGIQEQIKEWSKTKDFDSIAQFILGNEYHPFTEMEIYEQFLQHFSYKKEIYLKQFNKMINHHDETAIKKILLSRIIALFTLKCGKNVYVSVKKEEVEEFQTIDPFLTNTKLYRFLNNVCKYSINEHGHLGLFTLSRDSLVINEIKSIKNIYNDEWLYYASFTPLWLERIEKYSGVQDHNNKTIIFPSDDEYEDFHNRYNYEPDEQSMDLKERVVPEIKKEDKYIHFCKKYSQNNITNK